MRVTRFEETEEHYVRRDNCTTSYIFNSELTLKLKCHVQEDEKLLQKLYVLPHSSSQVSVAGATHRRNTALKGTGCLAVHGCGSCPLQLLQDFFRGSTPLVWLRLCVKFY